MKKNYYFCMYCKLEDIWLVYNTKSVLLIFKESNMENIGMAFMLMIVGMATVFTILLLIIYIAQQLIRFVNKYIPEEIVEKKNNTSAPALSPRKVAAITSAVNIITNGKGRIVTIEKL